MPGDDRKGRFAHAAGEKFYEIVRSLPETDIRIAEDKGGVKVAADRFDSRMQTLPREDFPTLPESGGHSERNAAVARRSRRWSPRPQFAITGEDTRFFLNGALFVLKPSEMSLVATDGHRLAIVTVDARRSRTRKTRTRCGRSCRRRRSANWPGCSTKASGDIALRDVAKTTCSSMSAAGC